MRDPIADFHISPYPAQAEPAGKDDDMPPTWFLIFVAFCIGWISNTALRILMGHEVYIAGQKANRVTTAFAMAIIFAAIGIVAAIMLGLIPDHAP